MKIVAVIPARYESSRFPGKPLADICGKPMIWYVYTQALRVEEFDSVYIATDDTRIEKVCKNLNLNVIITSNKHKTGTDRIGEVSKKIKADLYVNIQGDEPLLEPDTIKKVLEPFKNNTEAGVVNLMTKIKNPVEVTNFTVPKVITNKDGKGIYLTRAAAPYPKGKIDYDYYKQVCVYAFTPEALEFYCNYGQKYGKAKIEEIEDIEILRFIENGYYVKFIEVESDTIAVDTPNDLEKVRKLLDSKNLN